MRLATILAAILLPWVVKAQALESTQIPYGVKLALGKVPGAFNVIKFGKNSAVGATAETVWSAGGLYPWSAFELGAISLEILSSDVDDTSAGTGARTVLIEGLDTNYDPLTESVTLNGTSVVSLSNQFARVFRATVLTAGTSGFNEGTITLRVASAGATVLEIAVADNQTQMAVYTIPRAHVGCIDEYQTAISKKQASTAEVEIYIRPFGSVFQEKFIHALGSSSGSHKTTNFQTCIYVAEKSDIDVRAEATVEGTEVFADFELMVFRQ